MIKLHLVQLFFNSAYYDPPIDFLEEPSPIRKDESAMGNMREVEQIQNFLINSKGEYIEYYRKKIADIIQWSVSKGAHIIVFPEYSIPVQILPHLRVCAQKNSVVIVGGTHRISISSQTNEIYQSIGIDSKSLKSGSAIAPTFLNDGTVAISYKNKKSKWEPNLETTDRTPETFCVKIQNSDIYLAVIPCIDSLHVDVIGKLWSSKRNPPDLLICPSLSPSTEPFEHIGGISANKETLFCFSNSAKFGGTSFNIPSKWSPYLKGNVGAFASIPANIEGLLEVEVNHGAFFLKKGTVETSMPCSHPINFPIVYTKNCKWLDKYNELQTDILELLSDSDKKNAIEWIDSYL